MTHHFPSLNSAFREFSLIVLCTAGSLYKLVVTRYFFRLTFDETSKHCLLGRSPNYLEETGGSLTLVGIIALGVKVNVAGLSESEAKVFAEHWKQCTAPPYASPDISVHREPVNWATAYEHLTQQITRRAIEFNLGQLMMFHAAGLQFPGSNDVVGFVAASGTGKSTLTSTLGKRMGYVSDEVVAIDLELSVHPLQKPVSLIGRSNGAFKGHIGPDQLGLRTNLTSTPRLASLVLLNRVTEEHAPTLAPIPLERAVLNLVPQISGLGMMPSGLNSLCNVIKKLGGVYELTYSNAADISPAYLAKIMDDSHDGSALVWKHVPKDPSPAMMHGYRVAQADFFDAIEIEGRAIVLDKGQVRMLGELASAVWQLLPSTNSKSELLDRLEKKFGKHDDSEMILDRTLVDLKLQRLIEESPIG